jgi:5-hydroxyisourate hydrolase
MSAITTHVLDTARGRPAAGVTVTLDARDGPGTWQPIASGETDADGRLRSLLPDDRPLTPGVYRLTFDTAPYFTASGAASIYPQVVVVFETAGEAHYHLPLLISPFGYSTYRGT